MSKRKNILWGTTTAAILVLGMGMSNAGAQKAPKDFIVPELKGSPEELQKLKRVMPPRPQVKDQIDFPRVADPKSKTAKKHSKPKKKKVKTAHKTERSPKKLKIDGGQRYTYQSAKPAKPQRVWHSKATSHPVYVFERKSHRAKSKTELRHSKRQYAQHPSFSQKPIPYSMKHATKTCYVKKHTPAEYKTVTKRVLVRPEKVRKHIVPAQYREVDRRVLVRAERVKVKHHRARYGYVRERILVKPERVHVKTHPAITRYVNERVLVSPAQQRVHATPPQYSFVKRRVQVSPGRDYWTVSGYSGHCGTNPVYCRVQTPPQYIDQTQRVLVRPGQRYVQNIPARYQNIRRQVVVKSAYNERIVSPAVYKTIKRKVVISPEWNERIVIPAKYRIVRERVLVHPARKEVYREPAIYKTITKNVLVTREKTHFQRVHVKKGGC